tara:strand:- start:215 stop:400 length:186 start_codon:yes stop_codon:yes gene_type:complete
MKISPTCKFNPAPTASTLYLLESTRDTLVYVRIPDSEFSEERLATECEQRLYYPLSDWSIA